jgi:hypothetical protein
MRSPITYPKELRERAKRDKLNLVTMQALGVTFQGAVPAEEARTILVYIQREIQSRSKLAKTTASPEPPTDFESQSDELWSSLDCLFDAARAAWQRIVTEFPESVTMPELSNLSRQIDCAKETLNEYGSAE